MEKYTKPVVLTMDELAEGVYAASGAPAAEANGNGGIKCDSVYMNGVWQAPDYSYWTEGTRGYKKQFGCLGCPAYTESACGLQTHYVESGNAASYDVDNGKRKPSWEAKGYKPDDPVTDFNM